MLSKSYDGGICSDLLDEILCLNMATKNSLLSAQINNSSDSNSSSTCSSITTKKNRNLFLITDFRPSMTSLRKTRSYRLSSRTNNPPQALHTTPLEAVVVDVGVEEGTEVP